MNDENTGGNGHSFECNAADANNHLSFYFNSTTRETVHAKPAELRGPNSETDVDVVPTPAPAPTPTLAPPPMQRGRLRWPRATRRDWHADANRQYALEVNRQCRRSSSGSSNSNTRSVPQPSSTRAPAPASAPASANSATHDSGGASHAKNWLRNGDCSRGGSVGAPIASFGNSGVAPAAMRTKETPVDSKFDDLSQPGASKSSTEPAAPGRPRICFNECGRSTAGQGQNDSYYCCPGCRWHQEHDESCGDANRDVVDQVVPPNAPPPPPPPPQPPHVDEDDDVFVDDGDDTEPPQPDGAPPLPRPSQPAPPTGGALADEPPMPPPLDDPPPPPPVLDPPGPMYDHDEGGGRGGSIGGGGHGGSIGASLATRGDPAPSPTTPTPSPAPVLVRKYGRCMECSTTDGSRPTCHEDGTTLNLLGDVEPVQRSGGLGRRHNNDVRRVGRAARRTRPAHAL